MGESFPLTPPLSRREREYLSQRLRYAERRDWDLSGLSSSV